MLGEFLTRCLVLLFGYAYPALECFKSLEKKRVDSHELRFWCQYWIIVALLTVCERIIDLFFAWLPIYDELKLGLIIYLWYSKTKGTGFIYETLLRPSMSKHETEIERKLLELKTRTWDLAIYYWQNCTQLGHTAFFQVLDYLSSQSGRFNCSQIEEPQKAKNYKANAPLLSQYSFSEAKVTKHKPRRMRFFRRFKSA